MVNDGKRQHGTCGAANLGPPGGCLEDAGGDCLREPSARDCEGLDMQTTLDAKAAERHDWIIRKVGFFCPRGAGEIAEGSTGAKARKQGDAAASEKLK